MTPKERLKRLESYSVCGNYREKEEDFREIEKALEVLEIITKNKKFIDVCNFEIQFVDKESKKVYTIDELSKEMDF